MERILYIKIFAFFWGCTVDDLLVSFDGLSFNLPPEITKRCWNKGNIWTPKQNTFELFE